MRLATHCRYDLRCLEITFSIRVYGLSGILANDEVDLRTEVELEVCVTHEVKHLDPFDDPHSCDTLVYMHQLSFREVGI